MPLKNYTTEVSAMKSIGQIQGNLIAHGAKAIMINCDNSQEPVSLSFIVPTKHGDIPFKLPANTEKVFQLLVKQLTSSNYRCYDTAYQEAKRKKFKEQSGRVAWRIIKDWVDAQMAIIETEMVTIEQVFLPYMQVTNGRTLYEALVDRGFALPEGRG